MTGAPLEVVEFTDPACPWAWGSEPKFRRLRAMLGDQVRWRRVFGILFDDDDDPPPDPEAETAWYRGHVAEISAHTHAPFAPRLEWVCLTSWPASRAAKAAEAQGADTAERVLRRLREATFVLGTPADTEDGVLAVLEGVTGLDTGRLRRDLRSPEVAGAVRRDHEETRRPAREVVDLEGPGPHGGRAKNVNGCLRYALPTLLFAGPGGRAFVPGWRRLDEYTQAARLTCPQLHLDERLLGADEALERYLSLTGPELELLTGRSEPPERAVRVETGNGPLWLHPSEAAAHPAALRGR